MRFFRPPILYLLISLLIFLVTAQGLASGFVLCIGEDGHASYEHSLAGKCAPVEPVCVTADVCLGAFCADDHCGPCQDYATTFDSLHGRCRGDQDDNTSQQLPPDSSLVSPLPATFFVRDLTAKLSPQPPPRPTIAQTSLRTVVLRN